MKAKIGNIEVTLESVEDIKMLMEAESKEIKQANITITTSVETPQKPMQIKPKSIPVSPKIETKESELEQIKRRLDQRARPKKGTPFTEDERRVIQLLYGVVNKRCPSKIIKKMAKILHRKNRPILDQIHYLSKKGLLGKSAKPIAKMDHRRKPLSDRQQKIKEMLLAKKMPADIAQELKCSVQDIYKTKWKLKYRGEISKTDKSNLDKLDAILLESLSKSLPYSQIVGILKNNGMNTNVKYLYDRAYILRMRHPLIAKQLLPSAIKTLDVDFDILKGYDDYKQKKDLYLNLIYSYGQKMSSISQNDLMVFLQIPKSEASALIEDTFIQQGDIFKQLKMNKRFVRDMTNNCLEFRN